MTDSIKISVIMASYNNEDTINEAVTSILSQSFKEFEFLVVNDGSNDLTRKLLDDINDPRLRIIDNPENIGLTRSLNKAIAMSSGHFVARQDADDISMHERLEEQYNFMQRNPDVALLGTGRVTLETGGSKISVHKLPKEPTYSDLLKSNCFVHGSVMFRREVFEEVGPYDEDFRYTQDYDLWLRIAKKHRVMNLEKPLYGVRRHNNRVTFSQLEQAYLYRFLAKNKALGKVSTETIDRIREEGIDVYRNYLTKSEKISFARKAMSRNIRDGAYADAEKHLLQLTELSRNSLSLTLRLFFLRLKARKYHRRE